MKRFLSVLAAGIVAFSATMSAPRAEAATVGYKLIVTATGGGIYDGQTAEGGVFWDDASVPATGFVELSRTGEGGTTVDPVVGLFFNAGPYVFSELDAYATPFFTFVDGILQSISFIVTDDSTLVDLASFGVKLFTFDIARGALTFDGDVYRGNVIVKYLAPVPLPAGLPLLAGGLGLIALLRRRARRA